MNLQNVCFVKSAVQPSDFIRDGLPSVVFAGKSNVGKSSVINCLLNRKNFARVGANPGKTVHINYFRVDNQSYFIDLPGYGYAQVSHAERERWGKLMERFFADPEFISLGILIVDVRHPPTENDQIMSNWFLKTGCPMVVVANKTDKVKKSALPENLMTIRAVLRVPDEVLILPFSAEKRNGREALLARITDCTETMGN